MSQYFPKPYNGFARNTKVELDLSNFATKAYLKGTKGVDTSNLAAKSDLAGLKAEIDKIDVDKLKTVPVDLSNLRNVVNNDVVKKNVYDKLVAKVNAINTSGFVLKTKYDTDKSDLEKKIPDNGGLLKKADYNAKITEIEGKIPSITGLATTAALTVVENLTPNVGNLVKKTDYDAKIVDIESKYITKADYNEFTS